MATRTGTISDSASTGYPTKSGTISSTPQGRGGREYGDAEAKPGALLGDDPKAVAQLASELWQSQEPLWDKERAQWEHNLHIKDGYTQGRVMREENKWIAWLPLWAKNDPYRNSQHTNKAKVLAHRVTATLVADPPAPEGVPRSGEETDVESAEFATRVLLDVQGETGLNTTQKVRRSIDRSHVYGAAFERFFIDPRGGGPVPLEVDAGYAPIQLESGEEFVEREAEHIDEAEADPMTPGQPWPNYQKRFVRKDGSLTQNVAEAAVKYLPAIRSEILTGKNVRLIPHTAVDVWDAHGAIVAGYMAWDGVKQLFPHIAKLPVERIRGILNHRPPNGERLLAPGLRPSDLDNKTGDMQDKFPGNSLVYVQNTYYKCGDDYKDGLHLITLGETEIAFRGKLTAELENGETLRMDIPISQCSGFEDGEDGPYKKGLYEYLGPGNELRAQLIGAQLDYLDDIDNRKTYLPVSSTVTEDDLESGRKYIRVAHGVEPKHEQIPPFPPENWRMLQQADAEQDMASMLGQLAQGLDSPNVNSGRHAFAVMTSAVAGLSELKQNVVRFYVRGSRITLQLIRAYYDTERQIRFRGEDGRYTQKSWSNSDLGSTVDVDLQPGTMSLLTPGQKSQLAENYAQQGLIPPEEFRDIMQSNLGGTIGLQDDPVRMRVRRQIGEWAEGPPEGWRPAPPPMPPVDPMTGMPMVDPMTGMPAVVPPEQELMNDPGWHMWEPVPSDAMPDVAQVRLYELSRLMQSTRYMKQPREWRRAVDLEFQRISTILQPPPQQPAPPPAPTKVEVVNGAPGAMNAQGGGPELAGMAADARSQGMPG